MILHDFGKRMFSMNENEKEYDLHDFGKRMIIAVATAIRLGYRVVGQ
jgi:hypothetical protein